MRDRSVEQYTTKRIEVNWGFRTVVTHDPHDAYTIEPVPGVTVASTNEHHDHFLETVLPDEAMEFSIGEGSGELGFKYNDKPAVQEYERRCGALSETKPSRAPQWMMSEFEERGDGTIRLDVLGPYRIMLFQDESRKVIGLRPEGRPVTDSDVALPPLQLGLTLEQAHSIGTILRQAHRAAPQAPVAGDHPGRSREHHADHDADARKRDPRAGWQK